MSGLKLLAIRTGKIDDQILKVLNNYTLYQFYSEYTFFNGTKVVVKDEEVTKIEYNQIIPSELYNQQNLKFNVSAVVGKNGSGKSTLLELYFISIYLLSVHQKQLDTNFEKLDDFESELNRDQRVFTKKGKKITQQYEQVLKSLSKLKEDLDGIDDDELKFIPGFNGLIQKLNEYDRITEELGDESYYEIQRKWISDTKRKINELISLIDIEIFYELDNTCYALKVKQGQDINDFIDFRIIESNLSKKKSEKNRDIAIGEVLDLPVNLSKHFFYTIAISYSHYGLNSKEEGSWLNDLFHKNDSYQSPIVINPMRVEGNIDINKENDLVHQRMLSNLLERIDISKKTTLRNLAPNKIATKLFLKFNEDKFISYRERHDLNKIRNVDDCVFQLYEKYTGIKIQTNDEPSLEGTKFYLNNKLIRICTVYERYKKFIKNNEFQNIQQLVTTLIEDKSHVTFKLKQAMNFIRFKLISEKSPYKEFDIDIEGLSKFIDETIAEEKKAGRIKNVIEFLPPPTFDIRIQLDGGSFFEKMSSGEKQKIHSISSIAYHLINLNSSSENGYKKNDQSFCKYNYVNILFDEVEQYFHPDLQRTFINDLFEYLCSINPIHIKNIYGINILFATHSPFILSDIPNSNVLKLKEGAPESFNDYEQTFGANIYELLTHSFFMESTSGEFAINKVKEIVDFYYIVKQSNLQDLNYLKEKYNEKKYEFRFISENIGEDVIRGILKNHIQFIEENLFFEISKINN